MILIPDQSLVASVHLLASFVFIEAAFWRYCSYNEYYNDKFDYILETLSKAEKDYFKLVNSFCQALISNTWTCISQIIPKFDFDFTFLFVSFTFPFASMGFWFLQFSGQRCGVARDERYCFVCRWNSQFLSVFPLFWKTLSKQSAVFVAKQLGLLFFVRALKLSLSLSSFSFSKHHWMQFLLMAMPAFQFNI